MRKDGSRRRQINLHRIVNSQKQSAWIFHSPFLVRHGEVSISRPVVCAAFDLRGNCDFPVHSVKVEHAVHLH